MTDAATFEALVREYQDMVYATAVRLLANPTEAEDVAQIVFLKAFERFDEIGSHPAIAGWLKTVTTNLCLNHLSRYRSRWRFFSELTPEDGENFESSLATGDSVTARVDDGRAGSPSRPSADAHERLERALARLPAHQRVPLVLFHFEQTSYQDIARLLGVSLGKVKTDVHRGRLALKAQLTDDSGSR